MGSRVERRRATEEVAKPFEVSRWATIDQLPGCSGVGVERESVAIREDSSCCGAYVGDHEFGEVGLTNPNCHGAVDEGAVFGVVRTSRRWVRVRFLTVVDMRSHQSAFGHCTVAT